MLMEQPVQMPPAAIEPAGEVAHGQADQIGGGQFLENLGDVVFRAGGRAALRLNRLEFHGQQAGGNPQQLAPMVQVEIRRHLCKQPLAVLGQRRGGGKNLGRLEIFGEDVEQADSEAGEQRQQIFKADGKIAELKFVAGLGRADFASVHAVENQDIAGRERVNRAGRVKFSGAAVAKINRARRP